MVNTPKRAPGKAIIYSLMVLQYYWWSLKITLFHMRSTEEMLSDF